MCSYLNIVLIVKILQYSLDSIIDKIDIIDPWVVVGVQKVYI